MISTLEQLSHKSFIDEFDNIVASLFTEGDDVVVSEEEYVADDDKGSD